MSRLCRAVIHVPVIGTAPPALAGRVLPRLAPNDIGLTLLFSGRVGLCGHGQGPPRAQRNTGTEMFESADIVRYLDETYAL